MVSDSASLTMTPLPLPTCIGFDDDAVCGVDVADGGVVDIDLTGFLVKDVDAGEEAPYLVTSLGRFLIDVLKKGFLVFSFGGRTELNVIWSVD